jgi:hypothetical protein
MIHTFFENPSRQMADTAINLAMKGIPKKPVLASMVAITNLAALYLMQPEKLYAQLATVGIASGTAWIITEGGYYTTGKVKNLMMNYLFKQAMKDIPELLKEEKNEISHLLDSLFAENKKIQKNT